MSLKMFLLIIVLAFMTRDVHGCSCIGNPHPQDQFCSAAYVLYGKIIKEQFIPGPPDDTANNDAIWKYTFSILFKMKGITERVGSEVVIEIAENDGLCGVRLPVGKSYIIMVFKYLTVQGHAAKHRRKIPKGHSKSSFVKGQEVVDIHIKIISVALLRTHCAKDKEEDVCGLMMNSVN